MSRVRGFRSVVASYWAIARLVPAAGVPTVVALLTLDIVLGLLPPAFVIATSVVIGRVPAAVAGGTGSREWQDLVFAFALAAAVFVAQQILAPLQTSLGELMARRVDGTVQSRLIAASLRSTGIGPLEDQQLLNSLGLAAQAVETSFQTPGRACAGLLALVARYTQLLSFAAIVALAFHPLAALVLIGATMLFRTGQRGGLRTYGELFRTNFRLRREGRYLRDVATLAPAAKEIRVFGLSYWLSERFRKNRIEFLMPVWRERRRIYLKPYFFYTAFGLAAAAVLLAGAGTAAAHRDMSLTALALTLQATISGLMLGVFYAEADVQTQYGMFAYDGTLEFERGVDEFEARMSAARPAAALATAATPPTPAGLPRAALRFADLTFAYPGTDRRILDGLDLTIPAGRCTAIVGLNGAGKTTLMKLLARLYEPTSGALLVDGTDARAFEVNDWRRQIGIIFQDFNRYELSAAENIAFGAIDRCEERDCIRSAARKAGILHTLERLPNGLDTPLARQYRGGADLSGGQWQRVAIARALMALEGGATILVLDEPTAALDVRAEAAFFERFVEMTRGVTSILISHRFSSVRHADRIVVLEHGRVVEEGTHEELLDANGRYAELFRLQAERFTEEEEEPTEEATEADLVGDDEPGGPDEAPTDGETRVAERAARAGRVEETAR